MCLIQTLDNNGTIILFEAFSFSKISNTVSGTDCGKLSFFY